MKSQNLFLQQKHVQNCWNHSMFMPFQSDAAEYESLAKAGDATALLLPRLAYGDTFYLDDSEGRTQLYKSFFANLTITKVLKQSVQRERPNQHDNKAFPSGHNSVSFQTATFVYQRYGWKPATPAYVTASFVGYSRIRSDWHFGSDVLTGAIVGTLSDYYFTEPIAYTGFYGLSL